MSSKVAKLVGAYRDAVAALAARLTAQAMIRDLA